MSSTCIKVGISGNLRPPRQLTCWETQAHRPWGGVRLLQVALPHRVKGVPEWSWCDWGVSQADTWRELSGAGIVFRVPPSLSGVFGDREARQALRAAGVHSEYWIDDPSPERSIDPMVRLNPKSSHWKIHGWHAERWRQRYSREELTELARRALRLGPSTIVFGHPTRVEQALEFRALLQELA